MRKAEVANKFVISYFVVYTAEAGPVAFYFAVVPGQFAEMKEKGLDDLYEKTVQGYLDRFCSLEHFMKELKERFSRWFNKRHGRKGTLWQERYRSILVEDGEALRTMAAYIDLNALRAGLVDDPKDYRWCGYAEAVGGSKRARRGGVGRWGCRLIRGLRQGGRLIGGCYWGRVSRPGRVRYDSFLR